MYVKDILPIDLQLKDFLAGPGKSLSPKINKNIFPSTFALRTEAGRQKVKQCKKAVWRHFSWWEAIWRWRGNLIFASLLAAILERPGWQSCITMHSRLTSLIPTILKECDASSEPSEPPPALRAFLCRTARGPGTESWGCNLRPLGLVSRVLLRPCVCWQELEEGRWRWSSSPEIPGEGGLGL